MREMLRLQAGPTSWRLAGAGALRRAVIYLVLFDFCQTLVSPAGDSGQASRDEGMLALELSQGAVP